MGSIYNTQLRVASLIKHGLVEKTVSLHKLNLQNMFFKFRSFPILFKLTP